jgi:hypothetical protein
MFKKSINFIKVCELVKPEEVVHIFENELHEKLRLVTKNKEDYVKNKKYKIIVEEYE